MRSAATLSRRVGAAEAEMGQDGARLGGQEVLQRLVANEGPGAEAGHGGQGLRQAGHIGESFVEAPLEPLGLRLHHGGEDGPPPREVAVERGPGDAGLAGHVVDGQLGQAEAGDGPESAFDDPGGDFR